MQRFRAGRKRAAAKLLLPLAPLLIATPIAVAVTAVTGLTAAADGTSLASGEATAAGKVRSTVKLRVDRHVKAGKKVRIRGRVRPGGRRKVIVKVDRKRVKVVRAGPYGFFRAGWRTRKAGEYKLSVRVVPNGRAYGKRSRARRVNVYRSAAASYYGPGLYGNRTACGGTLTPSTVGVANKSLPCGVKLTLRYRGRSVRVRVIDRGPYAGDREFDLTERTKRRLGFPSTGTVLTTKG